MGMPTSQVFAFMDTVRNYLDIFTALSLQHNIVLLSSLSLLLLSIIKVPFKTTQIEIFLLKENYIHEREIHYKQCETNTVA